MSAALMPGSARGSTNERTSLTRLVYLSTGIGDHELREELLLGKREPLPPNRVHGANETSRGRKSGEPKRAKPENKLDEFRRFHRELDATSRKFSPIKKT
jgi:hypothetical protein